MNKKNFLAIALLAFATHEASAMGVCSTKGLFPKCTTPNAALKCLENAHPNETLILRDRVGMAPQQIAVSSKTEKKTVAFDSASNNVKMESYTFETEDPNCLGKLNGQVVELQDDEIVVVGGMVSNPPMTTNSSVDFTPRPSFVTQGNSAMVSNYPTTTNSSVDFTPRPSFAPQGNSGMVSNPPMTTNPSFESQGYPMAPNPQMNPQMAPNPSFESQGYPMAPNPQMAPNPYFESQENSSNNEFSRQGASSDFSNPNPEAQEHHHRKHHKHRAETN